MIVLVLAVLAAAAGFWFGVRKGTRGRGPGARRKENDGLQKSD